MKAKDKNGLQCKDCNAYRNLLIMFVEYGHAQPGRDAAKKTRNIERMLRETYTTTCPHYAKQAQA